MRDIQVYLAGGMSGLSFEEQIAWRDHIGNKIIAFAIGNINNRVRVFNPCDYYNLEEKSHKLEREPFEFDIFNLKRSDFVIANLNKQDSIGTCMELAIAKDNGIPVIGLYTGNEELHPWISECCIRICTSMRELEQYVCEYYLL